MRRPAVAAALVGLGLMASGASAQETGLASGLAGYEEPYTWESETLSFGISAGWLTGQSHEFFYDGAGDKISELIWDMNHAYTFNADLGIALLPTLKLNARGTWGGDIDSHMEDYDWLALEYGQTDWTHRSIHDETELEHFARFDINLQYDVIQDEALIISGLLGARFTGVKWSAYGGEFVYTTDPATTFRDDIFTLPDSTLGITYVQNWAVAYAGVSGTLKSGSWRLSGSIIGSPLAYGSDEDDHWLRSIKFENDLHRTNFVGTSAEAVYFFADHYEVFLNANAERYFRTKGDKTVNDGTEVEFNDTGGGDHENLQISLGFRVTN
jgi:outer membrane protease